MEILPSEYQHIELTRNEKIFIRNVMTNEQYGYLILDTNPAMLTNESMHILICADGIMFLKFFDDFNQPEQFGVIMPALVNGLYKQVASVITTKLLSNKALIDEHKKIKFSVNILYVFPVIRRDEVENVGDKKLQEFTKNHCLFKEDLQKVRSSLEEIETKFLANPIIDVSSAKFEINNDNVNSILQRIAPEYVTIRVSSIIDTATSTGADNELLIVTENDIAVKAYQLDAEQINIINKIRKGEQLILACAGSGKSVLLIAKCFKAARMNPEKQFLITCYNKNLYSLYTWFIDQAGLKEKNVTCLTFHALCKKLLLDNGFAVANKDFDGWVDNVMKRFNEGKIAGRYYGIFIDEVQQFKQEWYKFCFNLLENKNTEDHLFVICGDKTQKLANLQKHGRAPWNAGDGYPNYRGGYKNIRIERNYRNCIEINEYINRYVSLAKEYLFSISKDMELDPDEFLRGKSFFNGKGVTIKHLSNSSNQCEAVTVKESIEKIHDENDIPYDEIAVIMYNKIYRKRISGWNNKWFNLEYYLKKELEEADIPFCTMYGTDEDWGARYGDDGGVRLITFESTLGLDFRAGIVCGLIPLGEYNETKKPNWKIIKKDYDTFQRMLENTENDIRLLYVACTRAREALHIILPETGKTSVFVKMLEDAE